MRLKTKKIKNYKIFTEGLLTKLEGPSYDEIIRDLSANELLKICFNNLDENGIKYALESGASKELYYKLVEMKEWFLNLISNMNDVKSNKYSYSIFWKKNDDVLFVQDLINMRLLVTYDKIWSIFEKEYNYKPFYIKEFIKNMVDMYLNWNEFTPDVTWGHWEDI